MIVRTLAILGLSLGCGTVAAAQQLSANDIAAFFQERPTGPVKRGLCVGTALECGGAPERPKSMEMAVTFDPGSATLTTASKDVLAIFAEALTDDQMARRRFLVVGHTDARGADAANMYLSFQRAEAVVTYLERLGIAGSRLEIVAMGETRPKVDDPFDSANRRVELELR